MSDLQKQIERLNRLAKTVSDSELRVRCLAKELRVLAERVREKEQAMAAAGLFCYVSHIRSKAHRREMDRRTRGPRVVSGRAAHEPFPDKRA